MHTENKAFIFSHVLERLRSGDKVVSAILNIVNRWKNDDSHFSRFSMPSRGRTQQVGTQQPNLAR